MQTPTYYVRQVQKTFPSWKQSDRTISSSLRVKHSATTKNCVAM